MFGYSVCQATDKPFSILQILLLLFLILRFMEQQLVHDFFHKMKIRAGYDNLAWSVCICSALIWYFKYIHCWDCVFSFASLYSHINVEVVVYEGVIREKPSNKEEARQFIKGRMIFLYFLYLSFLCKILHSSFSLRLPCIFCVVGYSGGHAATVSSVLVANLSNGSRKGGFDKVEVLFTWTNFIVYSWSTIGTLGFFVWYSWSPLTF